ncbi:hypothetical protein PP713_08505 [Mycobacterium sp. CSUR Q5927]|nr:hypothetical protein [Mycobacterium sp. CSUR Q5927]
MPDTTVTDAGWTITEHERGDGGTTMCAYVRDEPVWVAYELLEPIAGYRWQIWPFGIGGPAGDHPAALVWDAAAARTWLEHEAAHALLAAKVVAA